jgi:ribosomal protein L11 methylase PrmA
VYWIALKVEVPAQAAEAASALMFEYGVSGLEELGVREGKRRFRAHLLWVPEVDAHVRKLRSDLRELGARLRTRRIQYVIPVSAAEGSGWCFETPMPVAFPDAIGERVVVKDPGDPFRPGPGQVVVELVPTRAFGNGAHNTTRLCVRALERFINPGDNVLDVGSGTGLLALAAARLGAGRVIGFDIEPAAVEAARENIAQNRLEGVVSALNADQLEGTARRMAGRVDLVVANLLPFIIREVLPHVKRALRPQGRFVISGLRADAVKDLDLAVLAQGFDVVDVTVDEEWCCLVYANVGPPLQVSVEALQSAAG